MNGRQNQIAIRFLVLSAMIAIVTSPVTAQPSQPAPTSSLQPLEDEDQAKRSLYQQFLESLKPDPLTAYKLAHEYLQKFPHDTVETRYIKKWIDHFILKEKLTRRYKVKKLIEEHRFDEAFVVGKAFLSSDPNDIPMIHLLIHGGLVAFNNNHYGVLPDAKSYAKLLLRLIESGEVKAEKKDIGLLYSEIGIFSLETAPAEAAVYFYTALQFDTLRKDAVTYSFLADAIIRAEYAPAHKEWCDRFPTPQLRLSAVAAPARRKVERAMDHIIDVLARAVALAGPTATHAELKSKWMKILKDFWTFRNNGYDTGLSEYIDVVLAKPLPATVYGKGDAH